MKSFTRPVGLFLQLMISFKFCINLLPASYLAHNTQLSSSQASLLPCPVYRIPLLAQLKTRQLKKELLLPHFSQRNLQKKRGHLRNFEINKQMSDLFYEDISSVFNLQRLNSPTKWLSTIEARISAVIINLSQLERKLLAQKM